MGLKGNLYSVPIFFFVVPMIVIHFVDYLSDPIPILYIEFLIKVLRKDVINMKEIIILFAFSLFLPSVVSAGESIECEAVFVIPIPYTLISKRKKLSIGIIKHLKDKFSESTTDLYVKGIRLQKKLDEFLEAGGTKYHIHYRGRLSLSYGGAKKVEIIPLHKNLLSEKSSSEEEMEGDLEKQEKIKVLAKRKGSRRLSKKKRPYKKENPKGCFECFFSCAKNF